MRISATRPAALVLLQAARVGTQIPGVSEAQ